MSSEEWLSLNRARSERRWPWSSGLALGTHPGGHRRHRRVVEQRRPGVPSHPSVTVQSLSTKATNGGVDDGHGLVAGGGRASVDRPSDQPGTMAPAHRRRWPRGRRRRRRPPPPAVPAPSDGQASVERAAPIVHGHHHGQRRGAGSAIPVRELGVGHARRRPVVGQPAGVGRHRSVGQQGARVPRAPSALRVISRPGCPPTRTVPPAKMRTDRSRTSPEPRRQRRSQRQAAVHRDHRPGHGSLSVPASHTRVSATSSGVSRRPMGCCSANDRVSASP